MNRAIIILTLVLSSNLYAADQKTGQIVQGLGNGVGATYTTIAGLGYMADCYSPNPVKYSCAQMWLAYSSTALQTTAAVLSFDNADAMDSGGRASLPSGVNTTDLGTTPQLPTPTRDLTDVRKAISSQGVEAQQKLDEMKAKGLDFSDLLTNPEKYGFTKEDVSKMQSEVAQFSSKGDSLNPEEAMKTILGESSSVETSGYSRDIATADASVSVSDMESFNFDTLFSGLMPKGALENSAPGYYGNVPLKVLNPGSKMSLFERVSSKMKSLM